MGKYYCEICGSQKALAKWGSRIPESWCYCTPATPHLMNPISFKKMTDYSKVLKGLVK